MKTDEDTETSSYVDKSLDEFLRKQGIIRGSCRYTDEGDDDDISASVNESVSCINFGECLTVDRIAAGENESIAAEVDDVYAYTNAPSELPSLSFCDDGELLLPSSYQLQKTLSELGYASYKIKSKDIDVSNRTVAIDAVEQWTQSILLSINELNERLNRQQTTIYDVSETAHRGAVSYGALQSRVADLQLKLLEAEKKIGSLETQKDLRDEVKSLKTKQTAQEANDLKKLTRSFEQQLQESERRVRQREHEIDRLKEKLQAVAQKEKETAARHRTALTALHTGAVDLDTSASVMTYARTGVRTHAPATTSTSKSSRPTGVSGSGGDKRQASLNTSFGSVRSTGSGNSSNSSNSGNTSANKVEAWELIDALEHKKDALQALNRELTAQVADLSAALRQRENRRMQLQTHGRDTGEEEEEEEEEEVDDVGSFLFEGELSFAVDESLTTGGNGAWAAGSRGRQSRLLPPTAQVKILRGTVDEQKRRIEQLETRCEAFTQSQQTADALTSQLRKRINELQDELENLRLELQARPTIKQWTLKQKELQEAEDKLHDVVMMRAESKELQGWKRHLDSSERIRVDKRNHELGLFLLESLPKQVMKEVLQTACRELDLSDIADIQPAIAKLKAVTMAVPRMERFITLVSTFVFQHWEEWSVLHNHHHSSSQQQQQQQEEEDNEDKNNNSNNNINSRQKSSNSNNSSSKKFTLEDVVPILKMWWADLQKLHTMEVFERELLKSQDRHENILTEIGTTGTGDDGQKGTHAHRPPTPITGTAGGEKMIRTEQHHQQQLQRALDWIADLSEFQLSVLQSQQSLQAADSYIKAKPEVVVNRVVEHLKYLFQVQNIEGLLPRMNQVYLFSEEMRNFLSTAKETLFMTGAQDRAVVSEILSRLSDHRKNHHIGHHYNPTTQRFGKQEEDEAREGDS